MRYYIGTGSGTSEVARELAKLGVEVVPATLPDALYESLGDVVVADLEDDAAADAVVDGLAGIAIPVEPFDRLMAALGSVPEIGSDATGWSVAPLGSDDAIGVGDSPREAIENALVSLRD